MLDIDKADEHNQLEVVFGVGAIQQVSGKGYEGITREDLMHDLLEERNYNPVAVVQRLIPKILVGGNYTPIYKYLRRAGYLDNNGTLLKEEELDAQVAEIAKNDTRTFATSGDTYRNRFNKDFLPNLQGKTLEKRIDFLSQQSARNVMNCMVYCPEELLDLNWMYDFLLTNKEFIATKAQTERGLYAKFISKYDYLRHKKA